MSDPNRPTFDEVRTALAALIKDATGHEAHPYQPSKINPPVSFAGTHEGTPADIDGTRAVQFAWWVAVPSNHVSKQADLDRLIVAVCDAVDTAGFLQLPDDREASVAWAEWGDYGDLEVGGVHCWAARITIEVLF